MSVVSGFTVICSACEEEDRTAGTAHNISLLNKWIGSRGQLTPVDGYYGGTKHPECFVAGGGFNYFPEDDFILEFQKLNWRAPENALLIIQPESGETKVIRAS